MISVFGTRSFNRKAGFWRRQFSDTATRPQIAFDVIFGIVMPILCFYFDPGVFRSEYGNGHYFSIGQYVMVVYIFSATAITCLALWLAFPQQFARYAPIIAGAFTPAAVFSFIVGVLMLPITLIGLIFIIGVLGFVPFATGIVYLRNVKRVLNAPTLDLKIQKPVSMILAAALVTMLAPIVIQWQVSETVDRSMNEIVNNNIPTNESAVKTVKYLRWFANTDEIAQVYTLETNNERKERLARIYREITGKDINARLVRLND